MIFTRSLYFKSGFLTIYLYISHGSSRNVILALCTALAIIVPADLLRFRSPQFARTYERYLGFLMRDSEKVRFIYYSANPPSNISMELIQHKWNGVIWYLLGVIFSLSAYPLDIAVVSVLMYVSLSPYSSGSFFTLNYSIVWLGLIRQLQHLAAYSVPILHDFLRVFHSFVSRLLLVNPSQDQSPLPSQAHASQCASGSISPPFVLQI